MIETIRHNWPNVFSKFRMCPLHAILQMKESHCFAFLLRMQCQPSKSQVMLHLPTAAADIEPIDTGEQVCLIPNLWLETKSMIRDMWGDKFSQKWPGVFKAQQYYCQCPLKWSELKYQIIWRLRFYLLPQHNYVPASHGFLKWLFCWILNLQKLNHVMLPWNTLRNWESRNTYINR